MENKPSKIQIRTTTEQKHKWKKLCSIQGITMTDLIVDSVENRIMDNERRKVLAFIESQDNIFIKIETNINQVARFVNGKKFITENELQRFSSLLEEIGKLKEEQNKIFLKIYSMLEK